MVTLGLTSLCLTNVYAQNVTIPDQNFKNALVTNTAINTNNDTEIQLSEAQAFTGKLDVEALSINNLTGIEAFTALTELNCGDNNLSTLDLSMNTALTSLNSWGNPLTSLNMGTNTGLKKFYCYFNQIPNLNTMISTWTDLEVLFCDLNPLTSLDVSNNTMLDTLICRHIGLQSLTIGSNSNLKVLDCNDNFLTQVDISNCPNLDRFTCNVNQISSLDISNNPNLKYLNCGMNQLSSLDVTAHSHLTDLLCHSNLLTSLDLSQNTVLDFLWCDYNSLTSLDLSNNQELTLVECTGNQLTALDVTQNPKLWVLGCGYNQITELDVSQNPFLEALGCSYTSLTSLNLTANPNLVQFQCGNTQIETLDLSQNPDLASFWCANNSSLTYVNIQNGNNANMTAYNSSSTPNLTCIQVDAVSLFSQSWMYKDANNTFSLDCGFGSTNAIEFAAESLSIAEDGNSIDILVNIANAPAIDVTVDVELLIGSSATEGDDFNYLSSQTLTFAANSTTVQSINIPIVDDGNDENDESILLRLTNLTGNTPIIIGTADTATITIIDNDTTNTNVRTIEEQDVNIFPNPFHDYVTIEMSDFQDYQVSVIDLRGRVLQEQNLNDSSTRLELKTLPKGVYFLRIRNQTTGEEITQKLIHS